MGYGDSLTHTGSMSPFSTHYPPRNELTANLADTFCSKFTQNNLICRPYESVPLGKGHLPGCTVHIPGKPHVHGQRKAAAALHANQHLPTVVATRGQWTHMNLTDLRPEQRSMNKVYMYAETQRTNFLKFPTKHTFDHRSN